MHDRWGNANSLRQDDLIIVAGIHKTQRQGQCCFGLHLPRCPYCVQGVFIASHQLLVCQSPLNHRKITSAEIGDFILTAPLFSWPSLNVIRRRKLQNLGITKLQQLAAVSPSRLPSLAKSAGLKLATLRRLRLQARLQWLGQ